ncbi:MAG TPA: hypothetical protein VKU89_01845 [Solirubrobacteraceae bacterium]|nr:hypothetical protein [Solirubrobacteraceae bacterium]
MDSTLDDPVVVKAETAVEVVAEVDMAAVGELEVMVDELAVVVGDEVVEAIDVALSDSMVTRAPLVVAAMASVPCAT